MTIEDQAALVDRHVEDLREHFQVVQILCSSENEDGGTLRIFRGRGNWFARIGMVREFVDSNKEVQPVRIVENGDDD